MTEVAWLSDSVSDCFDSVSDCFDIVSKVSSAWLLTRKPLQPHNLQDPLQRPNFVAILDHLGDLQEAGEMAKMDAYYNSHGCVFI